MATDQCLSYNCASIGNHTPNTCGTELLSGYSQLLLLRCGHGITSWTNAAQYTSAINSGYAILVREIRMGFDAPSPIEIEPNVSGAPSSVVNYDRTASVKDGNVNAGNDNWYSDANTGYTFAGFVAYSDSDPDNPRIRVVTGRVKLVGGLVAADNDTETERYEHTLKWKHKDGPVLYAAPTGIFD